MPASVEDIRGGGRVLQEHPRQLTGFNQSLVLGAAFYLMAILAIRRSAA